MPLPPLRDELQLTEGPRAHDGQPGWNLHDPASNRFYRLDWATFEILSRWSLDDPVLIARQIAAQTTLRPTPADVVSVAEFASKNQLLKLAGADNSAALADLHARARPAWWLWLVHHYLFFRVPLINPDRLLRRLLGPLDFFFRPAFWCLTAAALAAGLFLLARNWNAFTAAWVDFADFSGLVGYLVVIVFIKILHEFGHGLVSVRHGCRVPAMGVAFLVMTPVAYTDTNDAWRIARRGPRLWIGAAGIIVELTLAAWATLAWCLLPDGYLRSAAYMVATVTWIKSLLINISPIMRFDGYYLLSDALDLPNLHARCFALGRWRLREFLFGLGEDPPEPFRPELRRGLTLLAWFIWIYRLVVFLGIAIFVYHFFFKALGIALFVVEILWFILFPVLNELKIWHAKRAAILATRRTRVTLGVAVALLVLAAIPIPQRIRLSGELHPGQSLRVVAPESARLDTAPASAAVTSGAPLLRLDSPSLQSRHALATARLAALDARLASASADPAQRERLPVLRAEHATAAAALREAEAALARLAPVAPFDGVFQPAHPDLAPGEWIARDEYLGTLVGPGPWRVVAYLDETRAHLVAADRAAHFYPDGRRDTALRLRVVSVELDATRVLNHPTLAATAGGDVRVRRVQNELVPEKAVYRVTLELDHAESPTPDRVRRGRVVILAAPESVLARVGRAAASIVWREFGF